MKKSTAWISLLVILVADFFMNTGIMTFICWCFNTTFSWKAVFGIWLLSILISVRLINRYIPTKETTNQS